jgi:hypothetical protein
MEKRHMQINIIYVGALFSFIFSAFPQTLFAAEATFSVVPNPVAGDTATIIEVRIDPHNAPVNVVEGTIQIEDIGNSSTSVLVETGGSLLTLWPVKPMYNPDSKSISFTGGSRTNLLEEGLLFRLRVFSSVHESIRLSWTTISMYLGDGKASREPVASHSITIAVEKGTPNPINPSSADSIPPVIDQIEAGTSDEMYDGKKFIHVISADNKSGIDRIEVTENGVVTEAPNDTYVFQEQDSDSEILVTAYDKAGNSTSHKFPQKTSWILYVVLSIFILITIFYIHSRRNR